MGAFHKQLMVSYIIVLSLWLHDFVSLPLTHLAADLGLSIPR